MAQRKNKIIFLSSSLEFDTSPYSKRYPSDTIACKEALKALVNVISKSRNYFLICAYCPAVTDLLMHEYDNLMKTRTECSSIPFIQQVELFQGHSYKNLLTLRQTMMAAHDEIAAGIFIGGKEGVVTEYNMLKETHTEASFYPIASTGGAAQDILNNYLGDKNFPTKLFNQLAYEIDYQKLFKDLL